MPTMSLRLLQAIVGLQEGSPESFETIYGEFHETVYASVCSGLQSHDARDVCQMIWLKVWKARSVRDPTRFGGWLLAIARNAKTDVATHTMNTEPTH